MKSRNNKLFKAIASPWVSLHHPDKYSYDENIYHVNNGGCNSIFDNITVDVSGEIYSCCGLTIKEIPDFQIGNIDQLGTFQKIYDFSNRLSVENLMKLWVYVDGPINIMKKVTEWDDAIKIPRLAHQCLFCKLIFTDKHIKKVISENISTISTQIVDRYNSKVEFFNQFV